MGSHTKVCDELQHAQAPAALTMHPPQRRPHGLDGPCQLLQGPVQGILITLQGGPKGLDDGLRDEEGEHQVTKGQDVCIQWLWTFAATPCQLCHSPAQAQGTGTPCGCTSGTLQCRKAKSPNTQQYPP